MKTPAPEQAPPLQRLELEALIWRTVSIGSSESKLVAVVLEKLSNVLDVESLEWRDTQPETGQPITFVRHDGEELGAIFGNLDAESVGARFIRDIAPILARAMTAVRGNEALRTRWETQDALIEGTGLGVWEWFPMTGENQLSDRGLEILGYGREQLRRVSRGSLTNLVHRDDIAHLEDSMARHLLGETDFFEAEVRIRHGSGEWIWVHDRGKVVARTPEGTPTKVVGTLEDVSEKLAGREASDRLQRLESVDTLAAGVAHDFNNMLVGIQGGIELTLEIAEPDSEIAENLGIAAESLRRAAKLTRQLLTFAKGSEPTKQPIDPVELVRESVEFHFAGSGVGCVINEPDEIWLLNVDHGQIHQVIGNLLINARASTGDNGRIELTIENVRIGEDGDRFVRITVSDDGPGIPAEHAERIFEPYFTTKETGSGLGLAISHSIVKRHGGTISVTDGELGGAAFQVMLPAAAQGPAAIKRLVREQFDHWETVSLRVLVVDDDSGVRDIAKRLIARLGHETAVCESPEEALELFEREHSKRVGFDLVLLDLTFPGRMSGGDAVRRFRGIDDSAKIVLSTGYSEASPFTNWAAHDFDAALAKPYGLNDLREAIHAAMRPAPGR